MSGLSNRRLKVVRPCAHFVAGGEGNLLEASKPQPPSSIASLELTRPPSPNHAVRWSEYCGPPAKKISPLKRLANSAAFRGSRKQKRMRSRRSVPETPNAQLFAILQIELDHRIQFVTKTALGQAQLDEMRISDERPGYFSGQARHSSGPFGCWSMLSTLAEGAIHLIRKGLRQIGGYRSFLSRNKHLCRHSGHQLHAIQLNDCILGRE